MQLTSFSKQYIKYTQHLKNIIDVCVDLLHSKEAIKTKDYLLERDIPNEFKFGYFPSNDNLFLLFNTISKKLTNQLNITWDIPIQNGINKINIAQGIFNNHNLIFPIYDIYGNIISFGARTILNDEERKKQELQKYKYYKGPNQHLHLQFKKTLNLFGLYQAKTEILKKGYVIIVEGQIDCFSQIKISIKNVVALGGSSLSFYQLSLLKRYTNKIYLLLDNDDSGNKAAEKIIKKYGNEISIQKLEILEKSKDIDQFIKEREKEDVVKIFNNLGD